MLPGDQIHVPGRNGVHIIIDVEVCGLPVAPQGLLDMRPVDHDAQGSPVDVSHRQHGHRNQEQHPHGQARRDTGGAPGVRRASAVLRAPSVLSVPAGRTTVRTSASELP